MEQYLIAAIIAEASVIGVLWVALQRQAAKKDAIIEELARHKDEAMAAQIEAKQQLSDFWEEMARSYMENDDDSE